MHSQKSARSRQSFAAITVIVCTSFVLLVYLTQNVELPGLTSPLVNPKESLPEIQQVVFIKVHKAASTTVQNILIRFAMRRNLRLLLPRRGVILSQASKKIRRRNVVPHPKGKKHKFDILCNHVIYDREEISKYFPEKAPRVAILREPMQQALSAMVYYATSYPTKLLRNALKKYKDDPINAFLRHPTDFYETSKKWGPMTSYINNRMSLDLGFDPHGLEESKLNRSKIEQFVRRIDDNFDLVLISDYFDESMVLLRRFLRWSMKDIVYLKSNTAKHRPASSPYLNKPNITSEEKDDFRQWAVIDYKLYDHFLSKFLRTIKLELHFQEEVVAFKKIQKCIVDFCSNVTNQTLQIDANEWTESFTVSKYDCKLMGMKETALVDTVRGKQLQRYRKYKRRLKLSTTKASALDLKDLRNEKLEAKKRIH